MSRDSGECSDVEYEKIWEEIERMKKQIRRLNKAVRKIAKFINELVVVEYPDWYWEKIDF